MVVVVDVEVDGGSEGGLREGATKVIHHVRPHWKHSHLYFKTYTAGVTNSLVGVWREEEEEEEEGKEKKGRTEQILVRVYGKNTHLFIDRQQEIDTMKIVHEAGCGPNVYASFRNGLCYQFTPGLPLGRDDVTKKNVWTAVAREVAKYHNIKTGDKNKPMLFPKIRQFLSLLPHQFQDNNKQKRLEMSGCTREKLSQLADDLEANLTPLKCPVVFCHNDLTVENILWRQEGGNKEEGGEGSVSFIDLEYSAANYQPYDIANHFNEYCGTEKLDFSLYPSVASQRAWIRTYLGAYRGLKEEEVEVEVEEKEVEQWRSWVELFTLASHLLWGTWALLQAHHSELDFDFLQYGLLRLAECKRLKESILPSITEPVKPKNQDHHTQNNN